MANSIYESTGDGSTTDFTIPYSYLEADDVTAFVDGVSTSFTFTSSNIIQFAAAPANGAAIRIVRNTDIASLNVTYSDGGALTAKQLNDSNSQLLYGVQEAIDTANEALSLDNDGKFDAEVSSTNRIIKNVADPTSAQEVATKNYVDTASTSQVVQATSQATAAAASATAAAASASAAASSATASSTSASNASTSATAASVSAANSATSAANSATSAANSATSATNASNSEAAAGVSEVNAAASETLSQEWAEQTTGIVDSTGYSSKAWATGGTGVTATAGSGAAKEWSTETLSTVDGTEYSAKEYAIGTQIRGTTGSAKDWASYTAGTVDGSEYSAKYWAQQAANETQSQRDVYYGAFANDAAAQTWQTGTNGGTVDAGDQYFNTTSNIIRVYNGSAWNDAVVDTTGFASNGFAIAMAIAL